MRHGDKVNNLGRTASHRKAMMMNMACALIENKRIFTTLAKAKALRTYVEPIITRSKSDSTHSRRMVFSYLKSKDAVSTLFKEIAEKVSARPGGYTRIIKTGNRKGDAAEMALIELVDFNALYQPKKSNATAKAKTTRRGRAKKTTSTAPESNSSDSAESAE
jgi:large subunit ribosomal protein L17